MSESDEWMRRFFRDAPRADTGTLDDLLEMTIYVRAHARGLMHHAPRVFSVLVDATWDGTSPLVRTQAILRAMTPAERTDVTLFVFEPSRTTRVARGAGVREKDVADLIRRFVQQRESTKELLRWIRRGQP